MQKSINRRTLLVGMAVVGAGTVGVSASGLISSASGSNDPDSSPSGGMTLADGAGHTFIAISPSHAQFDEMVSDHFPALVGDQTFQSLKKVCVILQNVQGPGILAYKLRWTFTLASGLFSSEMTSFLRPRSVKSRPLKSCTRSAGRPVLKENSIVLLSPFFSLTSGKEPRRKPINWTKALHHRSVQEFLFLRLNEIKATTVALRSVIYRDHTALDNDHGQFASRIATKRNTEVQLARAVLKKFNDNITDPALRGALKRTFNAARFYGTPKQMIFHRARKQHARYLHDILLQNGRDKLQALVTKQAKQPTTQLRRLTPVGS